MGHTWLHCLAQEATLKGRHMVHLAAFKAIKPIWALLDVYCGFWKVNFIGQNISCMNFADQCSLGDYIVNF